jgi:hypothetical protein
MEHRYNIRFARRERVVIHVEGNTLLDGVIQNLSRGGAALTVKKSELVKCNTVVRVAIKPGPQLLILTALVIRNTEGGVALMFDEVDDQKIKVLDSLLRNDAVSDDGLAAA